MRSLKKSWVLSQVEGNTGTEDVNECKPFVLHAALDQLGQVADIAAVTACDVGGPVHDGTGDGVNRGLNAAERGALGAHAVAAGGRNLASGEAIDLVVHHDVGQVDVATGGVSEVVAADAVAIAVPAGDEYGEVVVGELGASGDSQGAAVEGVHPVGIEVARQVG